TGRYSARHGTKGVYFPGKGGLSPSEVTIAEMLKQSGDVTACFGKWHLGDNPNVLPTRQGFDEYLGIPYSNDMFIGPNQSFADDAVFRDGYTLEKAKSDQEFVKQNLGNRRKIKNERGLGNLVPLMRAQEIVEYPADQGTLTQRNFDHAIDFIRREKAKPFFVYLTPMMPHIPLVASKDFLGKSERGLYGDTVEEIDFHVGQLLDSLRDLGIDENTFVIFTSDNGPWLNLGDRSGSAGPLRDGKFSNYEGGVRVPCVVRFPGTIPEGTTSSAVLSTIDLLPTFAALSGAKLPNVSIDGLDVSAFFGNPDSGFDRPSFLYLKSGNVIGARSGDWKYLPKGGHRSDSDNTGPELFNVAIDVHEGDNRVESEPEHASRVARLIDRYTTELVAAASNTKAARSKLYGPNDRLAVGADGNINDPDDIGATCATLALLKAAGDRNKLVYYGFNDHVWDAEDPSHIKRDSKGRDGGERMRISVRRSRELFGYGEDYDDVFFDVFAEARKPNASLFDNAAVKSLTAAINASTESSRLWIVMSGRTEIIFQALSKADQQKIQHTVLVSHGARNNDHAAKNHDGHTWEQLKALIINSGGFVHSGATNAKRGEPDPQINKPRGQNGNAKVGLGTKADPTPFKDTGNADAQLVWEMMLLAEKMDISDAGMMYYLLTGQDENDFADLAAYILKK
ncbi:MAG: sulfatase-like hydrolase/transferase, partial [Planctomycetota bacterium]